MRWALALCALLLVVSMSGALEVGVQVLEAIACAAEGCESGDCSDSACGDCTDAACSDCSTVCSCSCCPQRVATVQREAIGVFSALQAAPALFAADEPLSALCGCDIFQPPRA